MNTSSADAPTSQNAIARAMGVSKSLASKWKNQGMPVHLGLDACMAWRKSQILPVPGSPPPAVKPPEPPSAPGFLSDAPLGGYAEERAGLARAQRLAQEMKNAIATGSYAPVSALESVLADIARQIAARLEALVPKIRQRLPDLPVAALDVIASEVHACRDLCAGANMANADALGADAEEDEAAT